MDLLCRIIGGRLASHSYGKQEEGDRIVLNQWKLRFLRFFKNVFHKWDVWK
jgi:hypothetical protein